MVADIFDRSRTLGRIEESMTDLLLCELVGTVPDFLRSLSETLDLGSSPSLVSVRRGVHESSLGETDVEIITDSIGTRYGLLIENKIRAFLMRDQLLRYRLRGEEGKSKGIWDQYRVVLSCPQKYADLLPSGEHALIDHVLSYEWMLDWLARRDAQRHAFKMHVLRTAIADSRSGYVKKRDSAMTAFHQGVFELASLYYSQLRMAWLEEAGYDDSIIHLPHALPARGDKLLLKAKMGTAELRVETRDPIQAERALARLVPAAWRTTRAKGYVGVEVAVRPINPSAPFADNEENVRHFLAALAELHTFYHRRDVSEAIERNRGPRR